MAKSELAAVLVIGAVVAWRTAIAVAAQADRVADGSAESGEIGFRGNGGRGSSAGETDELQAQQEAEQRP